MDAGHALLADPPAATQPPPAAEPTPAPQPQSTPLPCELRAELAEHCWMCHGAVPQYTAPMSLTSVEDFQAPSATEPGVSIAQRTQARIHDLQRPMPPRPLTSLRDSELHTLDAWIVAGARESGPQSCPAPASAPVATDALPSSMPTAGAAGSPGAMPRSMNAPPTAGSAADSGMPMAGQAAPTVPQPECVELRAHGQLSTQPFSVNNAKDLYECFEFDAPLGADEVYGVSFRPKLDDTKVLHHALLYQHADHVLDGDLSACARFYSNSSLIAAWAPGTGEMVLPDDVGIQLPAAGYTLEVHYNGTGEDRSGFEVCYERKPREHTAGMHYLGTTLIQGTSATSLCRPTSKTPITTLLYWPHMHLAGTHIKMVINRANGMAETWHDAPFDFNSQLLYKSDKVIQPGDTITTTCDYSKPVTYGEATNAEMCFVVVLAYPLGALTQPGGTPYATNQCIDGM